ncbi:bifunctional folylpolyglutamate synthase/dihydrofolate synthase [Paenibacillus peoriae]|jgi:dihydrofolate synthase/folylpolyglutamate synthase|uniref:bifunctional folylpolyglutamate synthase/dihydrofolate synthase n=1 Tax=Paenibacillus peoriae TaxID=59893 RepID=UPI00096F7DC4|nr:folylpolyglutamate synthase/dihydrofolate synthase family protein [Paenibacillus peoriae]OMF25743.1 bifunctional folylpolyglutamate synthase/dihydrofolate synthase [Paenibacillus peoriae]
MSDTIRGGDTAPLQSYDEAVEWINGLIPFGIRPGLERIEQLMSKLGDPQRHLKFVHIAGTNGKGSTCAFLTSVLLKCGYDVGTFTSPYITRFTNRFQFNGTDIPDETLVLLANRLYPLVKEIADSELGSPTMFEVSTALAILYYATVSFPDVVVWETGLGGRMDVTNIVSPIVSVITNVGYDHTDILGDTLEQIAREKAGIIKPGVPVVSCVSQPEAIQVIRETAAKQGATLYLAGEQFTYERLNGDETAQTFSFVGPFRHMEIDITLLGEHQCSNAAGAMMALEVLRQYMAFVLDDAELLEGFRQTAWAGRLEQVSTSPRIVLDGAHNPEGAQTLAKSLPQVYSYKKLVLMMGMLSNKHHEAYLQHILPLVDTLILTEPDFRRKMNAAELAHLVEKLRPSYAKTDLKIIVEGDWKKALGLLQSHTEAEDLGVVSGTLYLIADVRATLMYQTDSEKGW